MSDASHPSSPDPANPGHSNPPTHNHVFLCGGVGEWLYKSLAGITPLEPGYDVVGVKPRVSATLGPSSCNASVTTVRGVIKSSWQRHTRRVGGVGVGVGGGLAPDVDADLDPDRAPDPGLGLGPDLGLDLSATIPVGATARITIPLLGNKRQTVTVTDAYTGVELERARIGRDAADGAGAVAGVVSTSWVRDGFTGEDQLEVHVLAGVYRFRVRVRPQAPRP